MGEEGEAGARHKHSELPAVTGQLLAAPSLDPAPWEQSALPLWEQIPIYKGALCTLTPSANSVLTSCMLGAGLSPLSPP